MFYHVLLGHQSLHVTSSCPLSKRPSEVSKCLFQLIGIVLPKFLNLLNLAIDSQGYTDETEAGSQRSSCQWLTRVTNHTMSWLRNATTYAMPSVWIGHAYNQGSYSTEVPVNLSQPMGFVQPEFEIGLFEWPARTTSPFAKETPSALYRGLPLLRFPALSWEYQWVSTSVTMSKSSSYGKRCWQPWLRHIVDTSIQIQTLHALYLLSN